MITVSFRTLPRLNHFKVMVVKPEQLIPGTSFIATILNINDFWMMQRTHCRVHILEYDFLNDRWICGLAQEPMEFESSNLEKKDVCYYCRGKVSCDEEWGEILTLYSVITKETR
jgi:hypothetical protein